MPVARIPSSICQEVERIQRQFIWGHDMTRHLKSDNIGVILLNKYLLSTYGFRSPISPQLNPSSSDLAIILFFLTMSHISSCAALSNISIVFLKIVPHQAIKSRSQFYKIATLSVVFCASVVGGNISLRYLAVSFNQAGEPGFHMFGFIMCISSTAVRAFKSVLQGILLSSEGEKLNPMNLLLYMSPIAVVVLVPAVLIMKPNVIDVTTALGREKKFVDPSFT